jgi:AcrR family transcriptional regulator
VLDKAAALCNDCYMTIRNRLLRDCLSYFLRHGVANLSLRPLAASVGTSARMLLHYFGSKEALIAEVMEQVQERLQDCFQNLLRLEKSGTKKELLSKFWKILSQKSNQPSLRLLFEVQMLAIQNPKRYRRYLNKTSSSWRRLIEQALPARSTGAVTATLYNAVIDGLLLELLTSGDLARTTRALRLFIDRCAEKI